MKFIIIQVWRSVHRGGGKGKEHLHLKQGGRGVVSTKILWDQKITPPRAVIKRRGPGFLPGYFHRETEEKYNQKKSLAVWFPTYLILPGNLKS